MGRESLSQILFCFWDSTSPPTELGADIGWQLSTGGPVSNQAGVAGGELSPKVCISYRRVDESARDTGAALRPGCWTGAARVTGAAEGELSRRI